LDKLSALKNPGASVIFASLREIHPLFQTAALNNSTSWVRAAWILAGGLLLCFWGLYNGFPFVYPDTGIYLESGVTLTPPADRPLTYGLFTRHVSMRESLMWIIFAQGVLTSLLIYWLLRSFLPAVTPALFIGLIMALIGCSSLSVYVSFLMPDAFSALFYGGLGLFLLAPLSRRRQWAVLAFTFLALVMHNSHLAGGLIVVVLLAAGRLFPAIRAAVPLRRLLAAALLVAAGWLSVMSLHYAMGGPFAVQRASHVFRVARLNEMGLLKPYLDEACAAGKNYAICAYKDQLPGDMLWSAESPVYKTGGWEANRPEYQGILADFMTRPKYLKPFLIKGVNGALMQFFYFRLEDINKMLEGTSPFSVVSEKYPTELNAYRLAHQHHRNHFLNFEGNNTRQTYLFFAALLTGVLLLASAGWGRTVPGPLRQLYFFVFTALVVNAAVCSVLSTVASRFQGRLIWLFLMVSFMVVWHAWAPRAARLWTYLKNRQDLP
jgi:hypothetical protein